MTKLEIQQWLSTHNIHRFYTITDDLTVNVQWSVELSYEQITHLPFKFGIINGNFYINANRLTSIENCPDYVSGDFRCDSNIITSLKGAPSYVGGTFCCGSNLLTSLEYIPEKMDGFYFENNPFIENDHYFQTLYNVAMGENYSDDYDSLIFEMNHTEAKSFEDWILRRNRLETINNIILK